MNENVRKVMYDLFCICEDLVDYYHVIHQGDDTDVDMTILVQDRLPKDLKHIKDHAVHHAARQIVAYIRKTEPSVYALPKGYNPTEALNAYNRLASSIGSSSRVKLTDHTVYADQIK